MPNTFNPGDYIFFVLATAGQSTDTVVLTRQGNNSTGYSDIPTAMNEPNGGRVCVVQGKTHFCLHRSPTIVSPITARPLYSCYVDHHHLRQACPLFLQSCCRICGVASAACCCVSCIKMCNPPNIM